MNGFVEIGMGWLFVLSFFFVPAPLAVWLGWVWGGSRNNLKALFCLVAAEAVMLAVFTPVWRYLFSL